MTFTMIIYYEKIVESRIDSNKFTFTYDNDLNDLHVSRKKQKHPAYICKRPGASSS